MLFMPSFDPDFWIYADRSSKNILLMVEFERMSLRFKSLNAFDLEFKDLRS